MRLTVCVLGVLVLAATSVSAQSNWPQFRGEAAGVVADDPALPDSWGPGENIAWSIDVPGRSWSSPIVWNEHVFILTSTAVSGPEIPIQPVENYRARSLGGAMTRADVTVVSEPLRWVLYDVDFDTGAVRWEHTLHTSVPSLPTHQKSTFASETPVSDGRHVYVYLGDIGLFAVDFAGEPVWSVPMDWLPRREWGASSSPVLHGGRLYVVNDNDEQSFVAAYDAATGDELWRTDRDEGSNWSTPFVWENDLRTEIVTTGRGGVRSYGTDGELLWHLTGHVDAGHPDPIRRAWVAVHQLGVCCRPEPSGLRHPSRRQRRHHAGRGAPPATTTSSGRIHSSAPTTRRRWSTATTTTRCSIVAS